MKQRRAFALLIALASLFVMVTFATLFARFSFVAIRAERLAECDSRAELVLQSIAAWLTLNHATLQADLPETLSVYTSSASPPADVRVQRVAAGEGVFAAELVLPPGAMQTRLTARFSLTPQGRVVRR